MRSPGSSKAARPSARLARLKGADNTYSLFDLEDGVPTDANSLDEAVADGYLVPPKAISVPLKIVRSGLRYDDLSDEEKDHWDMLNGERMKSPRAWKRPR